MKKVITFLFCLMSLIIFNTKEAALIIPENSIRFRIIANSNSTNDQLLKINVKTAIIPLLENVSKDSSTIEQMRENIVNNIDSFHDEISKYTNKYTMTYGQNYFPIKEYKGIKYDDGYYESLVITIGEGLGDNWWCVLFPPLCLLEAKSSDLDQYEYSYYFEKIINKYF